METNELKPCPFCGVKRILYLINGCFVAIANQNQATMTAKIKQSKHGTGGLIMTEYIEKAELYKKIAELEKLAR